MLSSQKFSVPPLPTLVFGRGSALKIAKSIQALGLKAALIVTDKNLYAAGVLDPVIDAMKTEGIDVQVFDGVEPNPTDKNVEAGAAMLKKMGDACVIPIGGGSSMDAGKAIAVLGANEGTLEEAMAAKLKPAKAPVIAVPTTAGTGSETNNACVITNSAVGRKIYVIHPSILPRFAILDPDLTVGLPKYPTATCGFDVLTHATEAYMSVVANSFSDAIALEAIDMVANNVRRVVEDGSDIEARSQMLLASAKAAMAFNIAGLGTVHGTGHALSARLNAAHGQTLATMMPAVMEYNMPEREEKYAQIARILEPNGSGSGNAAIDAVLKLRSDIGIEKSVRDLGADDDLLPTLVEDAAADFVNRTNARPVDAAALEQLYRAAW